MRPLLASHRTLRTEKIMKIPIVKDGWVYILGTPLVLIFCAWLASFASWQTFSHILMALALVSCVFMFSFFRDPERSPSLDPDYVVSGADGTVRAVDVIDDPKYLGEKAVRISVYLSPFNVHINRAPMKGTVTDLKYTPGKHLLTKSNASSEHNEHSSILIENNGMKCVVHQIVGPLVRRVVYWLSLGQDLARAERIGLMKFGSRLDMYLPFDQVEILIKEGDRLQAGLSPVAKIKGSVS